MKLPPQQIESFIAQVPRACRAVLLYGPDEGMNRVRAQNIIRQKLGEKPDPFALIEWQAGELSADPARILDETQTLPFGGDQKIVYIRAATDTLATALASAIDQCPKFSSIIVEAAELTPKSALRQLFESLDERAAAVPAYEDEGRNLQQFVQGFFSSAKITLDSGVMPLLLQSLSGNRMVNQQELQKLLLYIEPRKTVTADDVESCLALQSDAELDDAVFAAFSGNAKSLIAALDSLKGEGMPAIALLRAAIRHTMRLHWAKSMLAAGAELDSTMKLLRPPVFFKKLRAFESQLRLWPQSSLMKISARLQDAETSCKSSGFPAEEIAAQTLIGICVQGQAFSKKYA